MIVEILILAAVSTVFYFYVGPALAVIFTIIWVDKALIPLLKFAGNFGFELATIPMALVGIVYGPVFGFVFGFLIVTFVGGILYMISWKISPPIDIGWPPLVPSPDNLIDGLVAAVAGSLAGLPFIMAMTIAIFSKAAFVSVKQQLMEGYVNFFERAMNFAINFLIVWYFQAHFLAIVSL